MGPNTEDSPKFSEYWDLEVESLGMQELQMQ